MKLHLTVAILWIMVFSVTDSIAIQVLSFVFIPVSSVMCVTLILEELINAIHESND